MEAQARLLGRARIGTTDGWLELRPEKTFAILAYLAYAHSWVDRDNLLYLFWPDSDEFRARRNLRQLLSRLRRGGYPGPVQTEADRVRWLVSTDVAEFRAALRETHYSRAVGAYGGPLLDGFRPHDLPAFDDWLDTERRVLEDEWREAASTLAGELEATERVTEAADLLERLYCSEPLDEEVLRRYLAALSRSNRKGKAREVYRSYRASIERELGVEPALTRAQFEELVERPPGPPAVTAVQGAGGIPVRTHTPTATSASVASGSGEGMAATAGSWPRSALPAQPTPFIGRSTEIAELTRLLGTHDCRLITVVGIGGVGKTRLALEVAARVSDEFEDGVTFVTFTATPAQDPMTSTIAAALDFPFYGHEDPKRQLLRSLSNKRLLLILDNVEHLRLAPDFITEILQAAPLLKLLVTSRERLRLRSEWIFELGGLPVPPPGVEGADFDSVRLFAQSARRSARAIELNEEARLTASHICRRVEGLPLAIELAASWMHVLPVVEIAREVDRSLDILEAQQRDGPDRQQSIRAVFDHSWSLLSDQERLAAASLVVFRGGFEREAALQVAGVELRLLAALVEKSLLQSRAGGRFDFHPLTHQYLESNCATGLTELGAELEALLHRHTKYYLGRLGTQWEERERDPRSHPELPQVEVDLENLFQAWEGAAATGKAELLRSCAPALGAYFNQRGSCQEGVRLMSRAIAGLDPALPAHHAALAQLYAELAHLLFRVDDFEESRRAAQSSLSLGPAESGSPSAGRALDTLGWLCMHTPGALPQARSYFQEKLAHHQRHGPALGVGIATARLGFLELRLGNYEEARRLREEAHRILLDVGDPMGIVTSYVGLGVLQMRLGKLGEARRLFGAGLEVARQSGNKQEEQLLLEYLGTVAFRLGEYENAEAKLSAALRLAAQRGHSSEAADRFIELALVVLARGDLDEGQRRLEQALELMREPPLGLPLGAWERVQLNLVHGVAQLQLARGDTGMARKLASLVASHSSASPELKESALTLLQSVCDGHAAVVEEPAAGGGSEWVLAEVVDELLTQGIQARARTGQR